MLKSTHMIFLALLTTTVTVYADVTIDPAGTGDYATIQLGINNVIPGETVWLEDGTYTGTGNIDLDFGGDDITVRSLSDNPEDCIIDCQGSGRGFYFHQGESNAAVVRSVTIRNGSPGANGGGIYCSGSSPLIEHCIIFNNNAGSSNTGGGIYIGSSSQIIVSKCVIEDNSSQDGAGVFCGSSGPATLVNCTIVENTGDRWGGGVTADYGASLLVTNCTIVDNSAGTLGGGILIMGSSTVSCVNCIVYDNSAGSGDEIYATSGITATADYCDIGELAPYNVTCSNCMFNVDPLFEEGNPFDYHLTETSPCINQGTDDTVTYPSLPVDDIDSHDRPNSTGYDIGSDEYWVTSCIVNPGGTGDFPNIQAAIDEIGEGGTVWLTNGTFSGTGNIGIEFNGKNVAVRSQNDNPNQCIIEGTGIIPVAFHFHSGECSASMIRGIEIYDNYGGAMRCENASSPTILNCRITSCTIHNGGGISCSDSSNPAITDCVFNSNYGIDNGGAIYCLNSSPQISQCVIDGNYAGDYGGAVYVQGSGSSPLIRNCTVNVVNLRLKVIDTSF